MAVRLNYTDRKKIEQQDARFRLRADGADLSFEADLRLGGYGIKDADARVWVEAYHRTSLMRFDFGRVGLLDPQANRRLALFPDPRAVLFRVKVVSETPVRGKLLAEANGIRPLQPDEADDYRTPLLPIRQGLTGHEVWRVEFDGPDEGPVLVINNSVENWSALARSPTFYPLVAPAAMRAILVRMLMIEAAAERETDGHWHQLWWQFATSLPGVPADGLDPGEEEDDEKYAQWIDDAVTAFSKQSGSLDRFLRATQQPPQGVQP